MNQTYRVVVTENAEQDLNEIVLFIAQRDKLVALEVFDRMQKKIFSLRNFPQKGRTVPELYNHNIVEYREIIEKPWRIIYKIEEENVTILTILDGRRNVEDILLKKLM